MHKLPRCPAPPFVALCLRAPPSPGDVGLMLCLSGKRRGRQPGVVESETGPCSVVGLIVASGPFLARSLVDLTCLWSRVTPGSASIRRPPGPLRLADLPLPQPARAPPAGRAGGFRCGIQRGRRWRPVSPSSWRCSSSRRSRQLVRQVASPASTRDLI